MADEFLSAWLKWGWAVAHSTSLETEIRQRAEGADFEPEFRVKAQYDAKRHGFAVVIDYIDPVPNEWRLGVGDVAFNFRCALDHLAWALYKRGRTPNLSDAKAKLAFPITTDRTKFKKLIGTKLPGVRRADIAVVRRYQPYASGKREWTGTSS